MKSKKTALLALIATTLFTGISHANEKSQLQNHDSIVAAVKDFLQNQLDSSEVTKSRIVVGRLDSRLKLNHCDEPLETFMSPGNKLIGKTTVGVRCHSPRPWALYVPATINTFSLVYQTVNQLEKNHVLEDRDIVTKEYNLARLNYGYFTNKNDLLGKQVRRRLRQGQVITPNQVKTPILVKRGERVALIAKSASFDIRMKGEALMDGTRGDKIRVKNLSSKRIVEGTVTRSGEVTVYN